MELFLVPVPLFDKYLAVEAYLFRYYLMGQSQVLLEKSPVMEALSKTGVDAFTGGRPLFVPVTVSRLSAIAQDCDLPEDLTVFLLENPELINKSNLGKMRQLREKGYHFALLQTQGTFNDPALLDLVDYILFDQYPMEHADRKAMVIRYTRQKKHLRIVATGLASPEVFNEVKKDNFHLYEGVFFREPVTRHDRELSPIKVNLIRLLDLVRDQNFEFKSIAEVMRRDPALSYSLMRFINSPYLGIKYKVKSIQHAVTILGQTEVRKWVTAAVFKALGSEHPSELTRMSLVRAKYAENLAPFFGLEEDANSLFLMGLFSSLDVMLNTTIEQALEKVHVSDEITAALVEHTGTYYPILEFIQHYERAEWQVVLRIQREYQLATKDVYDENLNAVSWYNELIAEQKIKLRRPPPAGIAYDL